MPVHDEGIFLQFFPGNSKLRLDWLRSVAEMRIQQAEQDPSPTKIEPLVALLDKLGHPSLCFMCNRMYCNEKTASISQCVMCIYLLCRIVWEGFSIGW